MLLVESGVGGVTIAEERPAVVIGEIVDMIFTLSQKRYGY
jgi:hypothetical protein